MGLSDLPRARSELGEPEDVGGVHDRVAARDPSGWPVRMSRAGQQGRDLWPQTSTADGDAWAQCGPLRSPRRLSYR